MRRVSKMKQKASANRAHRQHTKVPGNKPGFGFGFGYFYPNPKPEPENPIFSGTRPEPEPENPIFFGYFFKTRFLKTHFSRFFLLLNVRKKFYRLFLNYIN